MTKQILFICKYNRFRSRVAETYFKQINRDKKITTKSAGIIRGNSNLDPLEKKVCKTMNINLHGTPQGLSSALLKWQDTVIIVADDVPISIFKDNKKYGKRVVVWKIPDNKTDNKYEIEQIVAHIKKNVRKLVKEIT